MAESNEMPAVRNQLPPRDSSTLKESICPTFVLLQYSISCLHYSFSSSPGFILALFLHSHMILNCVILCAISYENCKWVCGLILANVINLRHVPLGLRARAISLFYNSSAISSRSVLKVTQCNEIHLASYELFSPTLEL